MSQVPSITFDYSIRVDGTDSGKLIEWLASDSGAYMVVREKHDDNPHFHVVLHSKKKIQPLRMSFRRKFPELSGNGGYSITLVRDLDKYHRYICKGSDRETEPDVVGANGLCYGAESIQQWHARYWDAAQERQRAVASLPVADAVLEKLKEDAVNWSNREKIAEEYIRELLARNKSINLHAVKAAVSLLQCKLCPDDSAIKDLAGHCVNY